MLAPIFVVILIVIYAKYLKVKISLKVRLPRKNTTLIFDLIVTFVAYFIYCHGKYILNSTQGLLWQGLGSDLINTNLTSN